MEAIPFIGANQELKPGRGPTEYSLPVRTEGDQWISCWQLTTEEIARVQETGRVWLLVVAKRHPIVSLHADEPASE